MKLTEIKGVGEKTEKAFAKAGVYSVEDLLSYYPRNYDIYSVPVYVDELENDAVAAIRGVVARIPDVKRVRNLTIISAYIKDDFGNTVKATWFNAPYLKKVLEPGSVHIFRGLVVAKGMELVFNQPKIFSESEYKKKMGQMQPIYPLVSGLTNTVVCKSVAAMLTDKDTIQDNLPPIFTDKYEFCDRDFALHNIHFPKNWDSMLRARKRLVFEEFFSFIYSMKRLKADTGICVNNHIIKPRPEIDRFIEELPYKLTGAQLTTWQDIKKDMVSDRTMNRLIQGDVGSGKTIIAILAMFSCALNGYQAALMAPTEVLAKQHYDEICHMIEEMKYDFKAVFLSGSTSSKDKKQIYKEIENNPDVKIIIGTHAIFQDKVKYSNLALVITDEQHRFGVRQRKAISLKGNNPHIMVMSATPIPRTLAIIMYGDLDISVINELPANRLPIKNAVVVKEYRPNIYRFIEKQISQGRQAYVICPSVENSEAIEGENVIDYADKLSKILPNAKIMFLHGRMKPSEKNDIMDRFSKNEIQILVSTTVVEVGVNVPNATVMMIENAERFGLAGLHQLRGRVGRGKYQSYCIFVNGSGKKEASERLNILSKSNDGFYIAEQDLKLRGPGDFFGVRQSGDMEFKLGDIYSDSRIVKLAARAVSDIEDGNIILTEDEMTKLNQFINNYTKLTDENINL